MIMMIKILLIISIRVKVKLDTQRISRKNLLRKPKQVFPSTCFSTYKQLINVHLFGFLFFFLFFSFLFGARLLETFFVVVEQPGQSVS